MAVLVSDIIYLFLKDTAVAINLPKKTEQVLFCSLSSVQRRIYREIIESPEVERAVRFRRPMFRYFIYRLSYWDIDKI